MDFLSLKPFEPRKYVAGDANLTDVNVVKSLYQSLLEKEVLSDQDLNDWVLHRSELDAAVGQVGSILYIDMTCQTDDPQKAKAYQDYMQTVVPAIKEINDALNKRLLELEQQFTLDHDRFYVHLRELKKDVELFNKDNIAIQVELQNLSQQYQTITGAMTVEFNGKIHTMPEMSKYQLQTDRQLRQQAWEASCNRRLEDKDKLDEIFSNMVAKRHQVALNAGFRNFRDYQFQAYHRFDYTPDDCKTYHQTTKDVLVDLSKKISEHRKSLMKLEDYRPWDGAVDPLGRAPLKPFEKVEDLLVKSENIFNKLDPQLGKWFSQMKQDGLLDLESRKGKAPGGYQSSLDETRKPFIFMNAVGVDYDVNTLVHEAGHAFHSLACVDEPLVDYRHAPMEFCEVASMAMELIAAEHLNEFYNEQDVKRSRYEHLEGVVSTLIWVAQVDAFQHFIYENPESSIEDRHNHWVKLSDQFSSGFADWQGYEHIKQVAWHRQLHIFEVPFYYIEYAIAQLGALQLWKLYKQDPKDALDKYKHALSLGGSRPLPELYEACGIKFDFSQETITPLMDFVSKQMEEFVA